MSAIADAVEDAAERLFRTSVTRAVMEASEQGFLDAAVWAAYAALEFTQLLAVEPHGLDDEADATAAAFRLALLTGRWHVPLPVVETLVGHRLLSFLGRDATSSLVIPVTDELHASKVGEAWRFRGVGRRVPWARHAHGFVLLADGPDGPLLGACAARVDGIVIDEGRNLAGEPRDGVEVDVVLSDVVPLTADRAEAIRDLAALLKAAAIVGAAEAVLERTVVHAGDRVQFGRPIGQFQAVQQQLAVLAGEIVSARAACELGFRAPAGGDWRRTAIAKIRAGVAAGLAAEVGHQVHGAIGIAAEYDLHRFTQRLWSWRAENGSEAHWADRLGRHVIRRGPGSLWSDLTELNLAGAVTG